MQTISLGNAFITIKGEWKENEDYEYLDAVTHQGSLFIAKKQFIPAGTAPGKNSAWLLAARGADEEIEKELIRSILSEHVDLSLAEGVHDFPQGEEGQFLTFKEDKLAWTIIEKPPISRFPVTQDTTWYVRTDGDDTNDGSEDTKDKAFKTIQGCFDYLYSHFTQAHGNITIQIGEGEFDGFELNGEHDGISNISIRGAGVGKTIITNNGTESKGCVCIRSYKKAILQDITFLFNDSIGVTEDTHVIVSDRCSYVALRNCLMEINENEGEHNIYVCTTSNYSTMILVAGNEFITKSTVTTSKITVVWAYMHSTIEMHDTITANGKMYYFLFIGDFSYFYCPKATTFVGTMTGARYSGYTSSVIGTEGKGVNAFPGNANGTLITGAAYY